ncbi:MAG: non-canonical purine NTP pyrophosphatase, partial [Gemmatimonadaceae bacterium]
MSREIILATRSVGKIRELAPMLGAVGWTVLSLDDAGIPLDPREDNLEVFDTFEANALAKARWFFTLSAGRPVLADDSGLAVDALDGRPGVRSKRWSDRADLDGQALDDANNALLIATLDASGAAEPWTGRYVCAAACVAPPTTSNSETIEIVATGECLGSIIREPRGTHGFGYDPYFMSADFSRTFGEVGREEKEQVSHRGRAFRL